MPLEPGLLLGGRYRLQRRLAGGGMGDVWVADDTVLGRPVAVKVPRAELSGDPDFSTRLLVEARHAASVAHPGIAAVYDVDAGSPVPFLVMELVEGQPLSQVLAEQGPLAPERVRHLVCQVAAVLAAAHGAGLVHRDVKPANLLVTADDTVKVTDFGIARAVDSAAVTRTGFVVGTAQYLSPEQAAGQPAGPASDLYALGVVAQELLTGRRPFDGEPLAVLHAHLRQEPPPLPADVPADLRALVAGLLVKDPAQRLTAADVVGGGAPAAVVVEPVVAEPAGAGPVERPWPVGPSRPAARLASAGEALRARPRRALAGAAALVVGSVLLGLPGGAAHDVGTASAEAAPGGAAPTPVPVASASLFHPGGSDDDKPGEVGLAVDGDPATAWTTQRYASATFGNLRPGVGLLLDLGEPRAVREVQVQLSSPGLSLRLHAGAAPDPAVLDAPPLAANPAAPTAVSLTPAEPVTARFLVLWVDRLPEGGGRAEVAEVVLLG